MQFIFMQTLIDSLKRAGAVFEVLLASASAPHRVDFTSQEDESDEMQSTMMIHSKESADYFCLLFVFCR